MRKQAGTGGSFKGKLGTVVRELECDGRSRCPRGQREGVGDGRCGWQPAKPLQLCSHVNNKQEKRCSLASFGRYQGAGVPGYLGTPLAPSPCRVHGPSPSISLQTQSLRTAQPAPCRTGSKSQRAIARFQPIAFRITLQTPQQRPTRPDSTRAHLSRLSTLSPSLVAV